VNRRIRCSTSLAIERIASWPDVRSAIAADSSGRIEIIADSAESVVRRLLDEDAQLADLEVQRAGLSEAFVELTREAA
jgi:ABC-2 type transport system ATP-binding protein